MRFSDTAQKTPKENRKTKKTYLNLNIDADVFMSRTQIQLKININTYICPVKTTLNVNKSLCINFFDWKYKANNTIKPIGTIRKLCNAQLVKWVMRTCFNIFLSSVSPFETSLRILSRKLINKAALPIPSAF